MEDRIALKPKSADDYVGRSNQCLYLVHIYIIVDNCGEIILQVAPRLRLLRSMH